jgi:hypothetical protein
MTGLVHASILGPQSPAESAHFSPMTPQERASAIAVPDVEFSQMSGKIDAVHPEVVLKVPFGPMVQSVELEYRPVGPLARVGPEFSAFDDRGTIVGTPGPAPSADSFIVTVHVSDLRGNGDGSGSVFVRVALPESVLSALATSAASSSPSDAAASSSASSLGFVVYVAKQNMAALSTQTQDSLEPTVWLPSSAAPRSLSPATDTAVADGADMALPAITVENPNDEMIPVPVATGPLPSRAAAAIGGVLSSGDSVTVVDRHDAALVDLALLDIEPGAEQIDAFQVAAGEGAIHAGDVGNGLSMSRGPGGFPLLASLMREPETQDLPLRLPEFSTGPATGEPADPTLPGANFLESPEIQGAGLASDEVARTRAVRDVSVLAGVSVAVAFATSLALPEVTDPSRDDVRPRSRLRAWLLRRFGRFSAGMLK